jgi:hypothetical protein
MPTTEQFRQMQHEHVSICLGIIQNAETLPTQRRMPRRQGFDEWTPL